MLRAIRVSHATGSKQAADKMTDNKHSQTKRKEELSAFTPVTHDACIGILHHTCGITDLVVTSTNSSSVSYEHICVIVNCILVQCIFQYVRMPTSYPSCTLHAARNMIGTAKYIEKGSPHYTKEAVNLKVQCTFAVCVHTFFVS
jgi:hypothetical protein